MGLVVWQAKCGPVSRDPSGCITIPSLLGSCSPLPEQNQPLLSAASAASSKALDVGEYKTGEETLLILPAFEREIASRGLIHSAFTVSLSSTSYRLIE